MNIKNFYMFKIGDKEVKLFGLFLDDNFNIAFKNSNIGISNLVLNETEGYLEKKYEKKTLKIKFKKEENKEVLEELINIKNYIIQDLKMYNERLKHGKEPIIWLNEGEMELFVTPTILKNGSLSQKYWKGMMYYYALFKKKKFEEVDFEKMQEDLKEYFKNNPFLCSEFIDGERYDACYFSDLAS